MNAVTLNNPIISPMDEAEARLCVDSIRAKTDDLKELVYALWSRDGWRALGYDSFHACCMREFGERHASTYYRLKDVANFEKNVSPNGENVVHSHAREFAKLKDNERQFKAFETAKQLAETEGANRMTAEHARRAVGIVLDEDYVSQKPHKVVTHMMTIGELSPMVAKRFCALLDKLSPTEQGVMQELMGTHGLNNPDLVMPIIGMMRREGTDHESLVLPEIKMGYLGGVALAKANMTDLKRASEEARLLHLADAEEKRRQEAIARGEKLPVCHTVTVWEGNPEKTVASLTRVLGEDGIDQLFRYLLDGAISPLKRHQMGDKDDVSSDLMGVSTTT